MLRLLARRLHGTPRVRYNYNHAYSFQRAPLRVHRFFQTLFALACASTFAYYMFWPRHTFPASVASILRQGLWAESDRGEHDYELALKYYLQALKECNTLEMDILSDEYTGIQLKVAEMYERLGLVSDAELVYDEISALYLSVLKNPNSQGIWLPEMVEHRGRLIQRDLRVALKIILLNVLNLNLQKSILAAHLAIAEAEVNDRLSAEDLAWLQKYPAGAPRENRLAFQPFGEEFFNGMEMLLAFVLGQGDMELALYLNYKILARMALAGVSAERQLLTRCNTASLVFFQMETAEAKWRELARKIAGAKGVDVGYVERAFESGNVAELKDDSLFAEAQDNFAKWRKYSAELAAQYQSVIADTKKLPLERLNDPQVVQVAALATYSLGVTALHRQDYDRAERLLREARARSRASGFEELLSLAEAELEKLFLEKTPKTASDTPEPDKDGVSACDVLITRVKQE